MNRTNISVQQIHVNGESFRDEEVIPPQHLICHSKQSCLTGPIIMTANVKHLCLKDYYGWMQYFACEHCKF